eukprot:81630_1
MKLDIKQQAMLRTHIDDEHYDTMAKGVGFSIEEAAILKLYLSTFLCGIEKIVDKKYDIQIIFNPIPESSLPTAIKENWKRGSQSFKLLCKRFFMVLIYSYCDIVLHKDKIQKIASTLVTVRTELLNIKKKLERKNIKIKNKIFSINETIASIL